MQSLKKLFNNFIDPRLGGHEGDKILLIVTGILIVFGLVMLSSASSVISYNNHQDSYYFFKKQIFGFLLGLIAFWIFSRIDYHLWKRYAFYMLIISVALLVLVFIPGLAAEWGNSRSWINIFGFSLQPSEFVKITFLLYLAAWLEGRKKKLEKITQGIGPFVVVLGGIGLLMLLQPDLGTLTIIALTSIVVYFVGGGGLKHILAIFLVAIITVGALAYIKPYQANRFRCFIDPGYSKQDICYQVNQSLIAVGSGGIFGRGLGASRQKYMYLPQVENDAIFPVIAEEGGLTISALLIILYLLFSYRGFLIAKNAADDYGKILAVGIVSWIIIQSLINIGGMINIIPMTGVPLPFISYGGSAMLALLSAVGILHNISKQTKNS